MHTLTSEFLPQPEETLGEYVRRLRGLKRLSQEQLAQGCGLHLQSIGKIERGLTTRLSRKAKQGLAQVLGVPVAYLEAAVRGTGVEMSHSLKLCLRCWTPGTVSELGWTDPRAKFCFLCGEGLCDRCPKCSHPITSEQYRFCPMCGQSYRDGKHKAVELRKTEQK